MKSGMTMREKVMLGILGFMCVVLAYYYLLYVPTQEEIVRYQEEYKTVDSNLVVAEGKVKIMAKMKAEIEEIKAGSAGSVKELPEYDNRQNLMSQLSEILADTNKYSVRFSSITADGTTISRQIVLDYSCNDYESAKAILQEICNGQYPCSIGNVQISNEGANMSMYITYYEYGTLE